MARKKGFLIDYNKIETGVWQLAEPLVAAAGAELIDVEYLHEAGAWYLRLYIDRDPAVDHALCEAVSELVSPALDRADPIPQSYYLEVSSPGLERPLKRERDLIRFAGSQVLLKLYAPQDGAREFSGRLLGLNEDGVGLQTAAGERRFPLDTVAHIRLKADFE